MELKKIVVVVPAFNEAGAIRNVLLEMPSEIRSVPVSVVVVDDGSRDATAELARSCGALVVRHMTNLGLGGATQTGLRAAQKLGADIIVTMDADGQHNPAEIERLVGCLIDESLDVVIGSGLMNTDQRHLSSVAFNLILNAATLVLYRKVVWDSHSGFKVMTRNAVDRLKLRSTGYAVSSEMIAEIYGKNLRYKSVPVNVARPATSTLREDHLLHSVELVFGLFAKWLRRV